MWPAQHDPANPEALPDFDGWGWDSYWSAAEWIQWHRAMVIRIGLDAANVRFVTEWQKQGFGAAPLDARSFDTSFRDYARANGFLDALYSGLGALAKPIGAGTDILDGVATTGRLIGDLLPFVALGFAAVYLVPLFLRKTAIK